MNKNNRIILALMFLTQFTTFCGTAYFSCRAVDFKGDGDVAAMFFIYSAVSFVMHVTITGLTFAYLLCIKDEEQR